MPKYADTFTIIPYAWEGAYLNIQICAYILRVDTQTNIQYQFESLAFK